MGDFFRGLWVNTDPVPYLGDFFRTLRVNTDPVPYLPGSSHDEGEAEFVSSTK